MKNSNLFFLFLLGYISTVSAQHQSIFPDLEGDNLLQQLAEDYKAENELLYDEARDTMFSRVDNQNDSLTAVYCGHRIYLDPTLDPTIAAFMDGSNNGINTEHTWPQAKGAEFGNPKADMHHLFPSRTPVNAARGNLPFGEIPDNQTQSWYYLTNTQSSIPSQHIDRYSEKSETRFEPREDHKGNVARAMFYFYTMYKTEADLADPNYFEIQRETLCEWHHQDPVDDREWERTWKIAEYQDGKPNPFVLDCTLPERSYCADIDLNCTPVVSVTTTEIPAFFELMPAEPNPFTDQTTIRYRLDRAFRVKLRVFDVHGRQIAVLVDSHQTAGVYELLLNDDILNHHQNSWLYVQILVADGSRSWSSMRKVVRLGGK